MTRIGERISRLLGKEDPVIDHDIAKSDEEWRAQLGDDAYKVLRKQATEAPFTGKYLHTKDDGMYCCAACAAELFDSKTKFDSGTGWPSFTEAGAADNVERRRDGLRTEVLCRRCGSHLGHVFGDGPAPSGQRYCINSVSLDLHPSNDGSERS